MNAYHDLSPSSTQFAAFLETIFNGTPLELSKFHTSNYNDEIARI